MSTPFHGGAALTPEEFASRRTFILELLNALYLDFGEMGLLKDAGPLLQELMTLAYYARHAHPRDEVMPSATGT
jgi:hypothetical protein